MKKSFLVIAFILAACILFSACEEIRAASSPSVSSTETPTPAPVTTHEPSSEEDEEFDYGKIDEVRAYLREYYSWVIEDADKCRIKVGDTEYYLDTSIIVDMYVMPEFPLYRLKDGDGQQPEYLGTTGFSFQKFGDYIYVQSDPAWEDMPDYRLTRIVNLKDLSITQAGRDMYIYAPKEGNKVYYTRDFDCIIYIADAPLRHVKELKIKIPDKNIIDEKVKELYGHDANDLSEDVGIKNVENGWIYFTYWMYEFEGPSYYEGNYRIKTDGSKIEKTDEGKFGDEIE